MTDTGLYLVYVGTHKGSADYVNAELWLTRQSAWTYVTDWLWIVKMDCYQGAQEAVTLLSSNRDENSPEPKFLVLELGRDLSFFGLSEYQRKWIASHADPTCALSFLDE